MQLTMETAPPVHRRCRPISADDASGAGPGGRGSSARRSCPVRSWAARIASSAPTDTPPDSTLAHKQEETPATPGRATAVTSQPIPHDQQLAQRMAQLVNWTLD